jgi:uncharacterized protein
MARHPTPSDDVDLEALDAWLLSDDSPENSMLIEDLDGFLTGIAVSPELIVPSEWLPHIWGGEEPVFASKAEAQRIMTAILGRYTQILEHLEAGPDSFDPVFAESREGYLIVSDWAAGFIDAAMLRPKSWESLLRDDVMAVVFYPLLLLGAEDDAHPPFGVPPAPASAMQALYQDAGAIIVDCVFRIRAFWQDHPPKPARKARSRRRQPKPRCPH